jgi:CRP-like cAMP-binding protein
MARNKLEPLLAAVPLFEGLSKRQLKKLASLSETADYMADATVVKTGEDGDRLFVVLRGQAKVIAGGKTVHRLLPGDHFGEISLLDGSPRTADVATETPMTLLIIERKAFLAALDADPDLAVALLESMARTIRRLDRSLDR